MKYLKDKAHSIYEKLKNISKSENSSFDYLLQRYVIERFLYRISISAYRKNLILKGANLFYVWTGKRARMTKDIDLFGDMDPDIDKIKQIIKSVCSITNGEDGIKFIDHNTEIFEIRENNIYKGLRILLKAKVHSALVPIQIDIGFGDDIYPEYENINFPSILKLDEPYLKSYSKYTVAAEKFEAMVNLGISNSRMKDFFDLWYMSKIFDFEGSVLIQSIEKTFKNRR